MKTYLYAGYFIGWVVVGAGYKSVVAQRLKQSRKRWTVHGGTAGTATQYCKRLTEIEDNGIFPQMSVATEIKIDRQNRAYLRKFARPGELFLAESPEKGVIILRKMKPKSFKTGKIKMTFDEAIDAIGQCRIKFKCNYDELRQMTREP